MGRPCVISVNYVEVNMIANSIKTGFSLTFAHTKINEYRRNEGANIFFNSAIIGFYNIIAKVVKYSNKIGTGSIDADVVWAVACYQWVKQIHIQLGKTVYDGND